MNYFSKYLKYKKKYLLLLGGSVNELSDFNIMCDKFEKSILNNECNNYLVYFSELIDYYNNNNDNTFKTNAKIRLTTLYENIKNKIDNINLNRHPNAYRLRNILSALLNEDNTNFTKLYNKLLTDFSHDSNVGYDMKLEETETPTNIDTYVETKTPTKTKTKTKTAVETKTDSDAESDLDSNLGLPETETRKYIKIAKHMNNNK